MKRIASVLILLCTIVSAYADGDVIEIWTAKDLKDLRDNVNNGTNTYAGKTVKLMADLDLGSGWVPIGIVDDVSETFQGTFKGQGYTIDIDVTTSSTVLGLFGYFYGIVENLKVTGTVFNTKTDYTSSTAGIVAYNKGIIRQCANLAQIQGTTAGGIAGENHGTITNCYHAGTIDATYGWGGEYFLGGIAGVLKGTEISNVYAYCDRMDNVSSTGGIVATNQGGKLTKCFYYVLLEGTSPIGNVPNTTSPINIKGTTLNGQLNKADDYTIWTFVDGKLPELTCFKIVQLSETDDNSGTLTTYNGQTRNVELSGRTLYKDGYWNTLCLPFDLTLNGSVLEGDGVVAKVLDGVHTSLNSAGLLSLTFTSIDVDATIPAGTPFIIKWNNTGSHLTNVRFCDVTLNNAAPTAVTFSNAFGALGQFVGTYSPFSIDAGNIGKIILLSGNNTLGYSQNPRTLRSCRAHFMIPTSSSIRAMMDFDIDFEGGESTGIAALNDNGEMINDNDSWWTLTGVKLEGKPTERGIYLHNGRKEAVR